MALNLWSSCLSLPSAGITGLPNHAWQFSSLERRQTQEGSKNEEFLLIQREVIPTMWPTLFIMPAVEGALEGVAWAQALLRRCMVALRNGKLLWVLDSNLTWQTGEKRGWACVAES
jgi:hypothetical protein